MLRILIIALLLFCTSVKCQDTQKYPTFPRQAEFLVENFINDGHNQRNNFECIYDYDANRLIIETEDTSEFYDYGILKKAIYSKNLLKQCYVTSIDRDNEYDGFSAMTNMNDSTTHIRSLEDFFLLSKNAYYLNSTILRGSIHVDQWVSSFDNETEIVWSIAKSTYRMPWSNTNYSIPIQRIIRRKDDGTILFVMNIFQYRTMITETDLTPPQGIFCEDLVNSNDLLSLQELGLIFPDSFSVRIDASTISRQSWQTVHVRSLTSNATKMIRYDYKPSDNLQNPQTIILDYTPGSQHAYRIDQRTGSCTINRTTEIFLTTSIIHNPIETLIKYENVFLSNPPQKIFQYVGERSCRGSITCSIFIGKLSTFPTGFDDQWSKVTVEWAWSKRDIDNTNSDYDYPVYLHMNLYQTNANIPPAMVHYDFYDYRADVYLNQFDISTCYRSNQLWYQHLAFQLRVNDEYSIDKVENEFMDRRGLREKIRIALVDAMAIRDVRVAQVELDHQSSEFGHNETLYCIFTLLDRIPFALPSTDIELLDVQKRLEDVINAGQLKIPSNIGLVFEAIPNSLENIQYFYSFHPNASLNQSNILVNTTIYINRTIIETVEEIYEKIQYSDGAQASAVVGGTTIGILSGTVLVLIAIHLMKKKAIQSSTGGLTFRNISFRMNPNSRREEPAIVTMEYPLHVRPSTDA